MQIVDWVFGDCVCVDKQTKPDLVRIVCGCCYSGFASNLRTVQLDLISVTMLRTLASRTTTVAAMLIRAASWLWMGEIEFVRLVKCSRLLEKMVQTERSVLHRRGLSARRASWLCVKPRTWRARIAYSCLFTQTQTTFMGEWGVFLEYWTDDEMVHLDLN